LAAGQTNNMQYEYSLTLQFALIFSQREGKLQEFELLAYEAACRSIQAYNLYWEKALLQVTNGKVPDPEGQNPSKGS
jgi:hypothetical protein